MVFFLSFRKILAKKDGTTALQKVPNFPMEYAIYPMQFKIKLKKKFPNFHVIL